MPIMTENGTFIINGVERTMIAQVIRSFGAFFNSRDVRGNRLFGVKIIPKKGSWLEFESELDGRIYVKIDKKKKFPVTTLLRIMGAKTDKNIRDLFSDPKTLEAIDATLKSHGNESYEDAYKDVYSKVRDARMGKFEVIKESVDFIFDSENLDISEIGRHRFNEAQGKKTTAAAKTNVNIDDIVYITNEIIRRNNDPKAMPDDIDHLGHRRVRLIGELFLETRIKTGLLRIKRNIQDRMSTADPTTTKLPSEIINPRPFQSSIHDFFVNNQLSHLLDQENLLSEINNITRLSALGPGGLTKERAGFNVRDIHPSQYGRICPLNTPDGDTIGLNLHFALYAKVNKFGIIETPYIKVDKGVVTKEIVYLNAIDEEDKNIAHNSIKIDDKGKIIGEVIPVRNMGEIQRVKANEVDYMDVAQNQILSISASLVPFLQNDDPKRSLMGARMLGQSVPLIKPEAPIVGTGLEETISRLTRRIVVAKEAGTIEKVDARKIEVKNIKGKKDIYPLDVFLKTNTSSPQHQRPIVGMGQKVKKGEILADASSTDKGQMAVGKNLKVAFLCFEGSNFEDAVVISKKLVKDDSLSSIHVETLYIDINDTKLGPEITTYDIPNTSESRLRNLDPEGVIRVGSDVRAKDILVGKLTPQSESQLTAEERLLQSIFGEKAKDMKNTSLKMPEGKKGRIIEIRVIDRKKGDSLPPGVIKRVYVTLAEVRSIQEGDKLAGRHGNKGVISKILPEEDMPFTEDGEPIDIILTPLGIPSRMNLGQIFEMHLGLAANTLNYQAVVPAFGGATAEEVEEELQKAGFDKSGKFKLFDGRTGELINQDVSIGYMYILKLEHMVSDKIHARSTGQYSLISQQPLGGRAREGGQRLGEMEVWALLAYGSAYTLREMLTIKSDDVFGRSAAFDSIIRSVPIRQANIPESFNVLLYYLRGLGLDVTFDKV